MVPITGPRRAEDQLVRPMFYAGLFCYAVAAIIAVILILQKVTFTWPIIVLVGLFVVIGSLMMPTHRVVAAIRFWRRGNGNGDGAASRTIT